MPMSNFETAVYADAEVGIDAGVEVYEGGADAEVGIDAGVEVYEGGADAEVGIDAGVEVYEGGADAEVGIDADVVVVGSLARPRILFSQTVYPSLRPTCI